MLYIYIFEDVLQYRINLLEYHKRIDLYCMIDKPHMNGDLEIYNHTRFIQS